MKSRIIITLIALMAPPLFACVTQSAQPHMGMSQDGYTGDLQKEESDVNREPSSTNSESKKSTTEETRPSAEPWSKQMRDGSRFTDRF